MCGPVRLDDDGPHPCCGDGCGSVEPPNVAVRFVVGRKSPADVMFVPGGGLSGALVKGPGREAKRLGTAAAIAVKRFVPIHRKDKGAPQHVLPDAFLADLLKTLEHAVGALSGAAVAAEEEMAAFRERHVESSAEAVLVALAGSFDLTTALKARPGSPKLAGRLRTDWQEATTFEDFVIGATSWRTDAGARGHTAVLFDPVGRRILTCGEGRNALQDPNFSAAAAYRRPALGDFSPQSAMGHRLAFPKPLVDCGRGSRLKIATSADVVSTRLTLDELLRWRVAHHNFIEARRALCAGRSLGLDPALSRSYAVLVPRTLDPPVFDKSAQRFIWRLIDRGGGTLDLHLTHRSGVPRDLSAQVRHILGSATKAMPILVEAAHGRDGVAIRPLTLFREDGPVLQAVNIGFERVPTHKRRFSLRTLMEQRALVTPQPSLAAEIAERALRVLTEETGRRARSGTSPAPVRWRGGRQAALPLPRLTSHVAHQWPRTWCDTQTSPLGGQSLYNATAPSCRNGRATAS